MRVRITLRAAYQILKDGVLWTNRIHKISSESTFHIHPFKSLVLILSKTNSMKKIISGVFLYPGRVGGAENFFYNLLEGILTLKRDGEFDIIINEEIEITNDVVNKYHKIPIKFHFNRGLFDYLPKLYFNINPYTLYFSPNYITPFYVEKKTRLVTVIHDLQYLHFPEYFSKAKYIWLYLSHLNTLRKSDRVICISQHVKDDIINKFGLHFEPKLKVIPNPIDLNRFENQASTSSSNPYILSVCAQYPHKNLLTLIKAFKLFHSDYPDYELKLVGQLSQNLVGSNKSYSNILNNEIKSCKSIIVCGYVDDYELGDLYKGCVFFVFPSLFEGFGMPPVEAMCFGKPVITSNRASLHEVTLGKAIYVDNPERPEEFRDKMTMVAKNLTKYSNEFYSIKETVKETYAPKNIANKYLTVFDEVLNESRY